MRHSVNRPYAPSKPSAAANVAAFRQGERFPLGVRLFSGDGAQPIGPCHADHGGSPQELVAEDELEGQAGAVISGVGRELVPDGSHGGGEDVADEQGDDDFRGGKPAHMQGGTRGGQGGADF